jgi:FeS assembly SUF system regulator
MIRLSRLADYGVTLMAQLASRPGMLITAPDLALVSGLGVPTVSKVLKLLAQNELVASQRGTKGGYSLVRRAEDIPVAEIIRAVDGPIALTDCMAPETNCDLEGLCPTQTNWRKINDVVSEALEMVSLADMMTTDLSFVPPSHSPRDGLPPPGLGEQGTEA